ncbi:MAG: glycosyltransferase family 39 protein [Candidatus Aureabacteria bacterium]|nr:glycosyltransferase family 39 protein [Candidatus Auribacterota bacterium]
MRVAHYVKSLLNIAFSFVRARQMPRAADGAVLLLLFGFSFFYSLGHNPLLNPDEGRYAEIPREMHELHDFITPHLNYVPYFEKPPLYYWLNAVSFRLFGQTEFAVRFFSALSGLLGILLTWHIGRTIYGRREGFLGALILGTSIGYLIMGRLSITDMVLTCLMTASLGSLLLASRDGEPHKGFYYYLFYACMALAVLTKGLIGIVLPAAILIIYLSLTRRWTLLKEMRLFTGLALFLLISAPWFVLVSIRNSDFPRFFFIHEHLQRYLTTHHHRYESFWFFIPVLFGCMFPWSCFFPSAASRVVRGLKNTDKDSSLFLAVWAVLILCFFSFSHSKLVPYILPVFPALALLTGKTFSLFMDDAFKSAGITARFLLVLLLGGVGGVLLYPFLASSPYLNATGGAIYAILVLIEALCVSYSIRTRNAAGLFLGLCVITYTQGVVGPKYIFDKIIQERSVKELALIVKEKMRPEDKVCSYGFYMQDMPYYIKKRVVCVDVPSDLEFGSTQGNQSSWFLDYVQFYRLWDSQDRLFTLIYDDDIGGLRKAVKTPIRYLGRKGDRLIVSNR